MKFVPHTYQRHAIQHILTKSAVGLFLDMGLGKTVITLTAINELMFDHFEVSRVLGPKKKRVQALKAPADIYVINRENVRWLVQFYNRQWPFDMVVIDELSSFKSSKSERFRALRKVRSYIKRIVGLTGTPAPNGLIDLWPQVYLLDQGDRLGKTLSGYRTRYFVPGKKKDHIVYEWIPVSEETIYQKVSDICISMKAADWLDVPERLDRIVSVRMPEAAKKKYKQLERDLLLPFSDGDVVADTAAVLAGKLLQMANGAVYDEEEAVKEIHSAKLDALEDVVEAANGKPVLVFYTYKHDLSRIRQRFPSVRALGSAADIQDWNAGRIPILLAHPASAGHGLNLQAGGNIIVWFGLTWSLELYEQANARLHRQGQREKVIIHHLMTEGTIDQDVMKALEGKAVEQNALIEAVKARIKEAAGS